MPARSSLPRILFINAALGGSLGNTAGALASLQDSLAGRGKVRTLTLASLPTLSQVRRELRAADGFVFATGTHWDSWSRLLQGLLEELTPDEGTALWLGKPAGIVVTEHSTGGKGVLSRLQGVLCTLGCQIPPMSGVVLSEAVQISRTHAPDRAEDFWSPGDLEVVAHNLLEAAKGKRSWKAWPVDRKDFRKRWWA